VTTIHQDARLFVAELRDNESVAHTLAPERHAWVQVVEGTVSVNGSTLKEGDGAAISGEQKVSVSGFGPGGEILLFDLA
jgi:redox-sensitive bicupin YhaK (pirin superfamily)